MKALLAIIGARIAPSCSGCVERLIGCYLTWHSDACAVCGSTPQHKIPNCSSANLYRTSAEENVRARWEISWCHTSGKHREEWR